MSTLDTGLTLIRSAADRLSAANGKLGHAFKSWMPTGLYARALLSDETGIFAESSSVRGSREALVMVLARCFNTDVAINGCSPT